MAEERHHVSAGSAASRAGECPPTERSGREAAGTNLEYVPCNLCGGDKTQNAFSNVWDRLHRIPGSWTLVRCAQCGLVYLNPRPSEAGISAFYPDEYPSYQVFAHGRRPSVAVFQWLRRTVRDVCAIPYRMRFGVELADWRPFGQGRVLDIGRGNGGLLDSLRRKGWQVYGIDADARAVANARSLLQTDTILCGRIEQTDLPWKSFDLVVLWHTLEHVHDPLETLRRVHSLLAPSGLLALAVPNIDSPEARLFGQRWRGLEVPRHLFHFSAHTLRSMLARAGFEVVRMRPQWCPTSFTESVVFRLEDLFAVKEPWHGLRFFLFYILCVPAVVSYLFGNWAVLEAHARRIEGGGC